MAYRIKHGTIVVEADNAREVADVVLALSNKNQSPEVVELPAAELLQEPSQSLQDQPDKVEGKRALHDKVEGRRARDAGIEVGQVWCNRTNPSIMAKVERIFLYRHGENWIEKVAVSYVGDGESRRTSWTMQVGSLVYNYDRVRPEPAPTVAAPVYRPKGTARGYARHSVFVLEGPTKDGRVHISNVDGSNERWITHRTLKRKYVPVGYGRDVD